MRKITVEVKIKVPVLVKGVITINADDDVNIGKFVNNYINGNNNGIADIEDEQYEIDTDDLTSEDIIELINIKNCTLIDYNIIDSR